MIESAAYLVDHVLPAQPIRQWVLSFPYPLRFLLANRPEIQNQRLVIVYRTARTALTASGYGTRHELARSFVFGPRSRPGGRATTTAMGSIPATAREFRYSTSSRHRSIILPMRTCARRRIRRWHRRPNAHLRRCRRRGAFGVVCPLHAVCIRRPLE